VGDIEDGGFVRQALAGAEAAYLLIPPNLVTDDFRAYQKRVVENLASGVEAARVGHVVLLSSIGAHHREGTGPIVGVHEFEERLSKIGSLAALFVRAGFFMENVFMGLGSIKEQSVYGAPMPPDATVEMIASADIGAYAGQRLERLDFTGKSVVHLLGPTPVAQVEIARILGQAVGKAVRYAQVSFEVVEKGMLQAGVKPSVVAAFMEMYQGAAKGLVAPEPGQPVAHAPTTFESFAQNVFAPAFPK
jgi:uncharacterized protein YbjT (DUF2867 family)